MVICSYNSIFWGHKKNWQHEVFLVTFSVSVVGLLKVRMLRFDKSNDDDDDNDDGDDDNNYNDDNNGDNDGGGGAGAADDATDDVDHNDAFLVGILTFFK